MKKFKVELQTLKEIYPPFLLLLVFTPVFVGFFIDLELFDSRYILINILWIPIFTVPACLFQQKNIYKLATVGYFLAGFIEITHWIILKGPITLTSLLVVSNTNFQEAQDFFDLKASFELLLLIPYTILFLISFRNSPTYSPSKSKPYFLVAISLIVAIFIFENAINGRLVRKGTPQLVKVGFSFIEQRNLYNEAMQELTPKTLNASSTFQENQQTVILILGESCNRKHMSLYGASRNTNPKLGTRTDLITYNDVVSPYSNTLNSVLTILSNSSLEQKISFENSIDILDIFHSVGFQTYWISNQSPIGIWDNMVTVFAKKSDSFKFVNTTSNTSFEAIQSISYDSKLFKPFSNALKESVPKKLIVLHLMGSHASYPKRYPNNFDIFKGNNSKEKIIAEYDNSILYNDYIVDSLLNIIATTSSIQHNNITSAIYISDHGENVYDELDRVGHDYSNKLPKANVEIPFIVWLSEAYIKSYPAKVESIKNNTNKPFVSDDLFHSMMDLNGIKSPYLQEEKSVFSVRFNDKRIRILEDGKDYDKK